MERGWKIRVEWMEAKGKSVSGEWSAGRNAAKKSGRLRIFFRKCPLVLEMRFW